MTVPVKDSRLEFTDNGMCRDYFAKFEDITRHLVQIALTAAPSAEKGRFGEAENGIIADYLHHLSNSLAALSMKYLLTGLVHHRLPAKLAIDQTDSGFPVFREIMKLKEDKSKAKKRLQALPEPEQIKNGIVDRLFAEHRISEAASAVLLGGKRIKEWRSCCKDAGLKTSADMFFQPEGQNAKLQHPTPELIEAAMVQLLDKNPVDAIVAENDYWAARLIQAAMARGKRVPEDLAVIGYSNSEVGLYHEPSITTIAKPIIQTTEVFSTSCLLVVVVAGVRSGPMMIANPVQPGGTPPGRPGSPAAPFDGPQNRC